MGIIYSRKRENACVKCSRALYYAICSWPINLSLNQLLLSAKIRLAKIRELI